MSTIKQRHEVIIRLLQQEGGRLSVTELSDALQVSEVTIRQDLRALAEANVLDRVYGGAVLRENSSLASTELSFEARMREASREKAAIGKAAAQLVRDGYGIALDGSTTASALVPHLKALQNLTVVTNSLIIVQSFRDTPRNKVLVPSGRIRGESATIVGSPDSVPDINLNFGFFGAWGVSLDAGVTDVDPDEVDMRRALMARCLNCVIIADARKLGETAPYTFAALDEVERVITSGDLHADTLRIFREHGLRIEIAPV